MGTTEGFVVLHKALWHYCWLRAYVHTSVCAYMCACVHELACPQLQVEKMLSRQLNHINPGCSASCSVQYSTVLHTRAMCWSACEPDGTSFPELYRPTCAVQRADCAMIAACLQFYSVCSCTIGSGCALDATSPRLLDSCSGRLGI